MGWRSARRAVGTAGLIAALALGTAACGDDDADTAAAGKDTSTSAPVDTGEAKPDVPVDQAIADAAKEEGTVLVYTNANEEQTAPLAASFEKAYPGVKVKTLSLNGDEVVQRYLSEAASGGTTADLIVVSNTVGWLDLVERGAIEDYEDPNVKNLPDYARLAPGVVAVSEDAMMAYFNKSVLPEDEQPDTLAGLADMASGLKGKLGTTNVAVTPQAYEATAAYVAKAGEDGWKVLEQLGRASKVENSTGSLITKLAQGQYAAAYFAAGSVRPLLPDDVAPIISAKYLTDATAVVPRGAGVTKAGKHPNAAKALLNHMLSIAGQEAACQGGITPFRDGVECEFQLAETKAAVGEENLIFGTYDEQLVTQRDQLIDRWNTAFGR